MLRRIFPKQIDNNYCGYQLAVWLLALFLLVRTFASITQIGLNPLWTNAEVLEAVEGVPLQTFSTEGASAAIVLFAWWGATNLMLNLLGFVALIRYRAMIPLVYALILGSHIGQVAIVETAPIHGMLGAGASRPVAGLAVLLIGFAMSVSAPHRRTDTPSQRRQQRGQDLR